MKELVRALAEWWSPPVEEPDLSDLDRLVEENHRHRQRAIEASREAKVRLSRVKLIIQAADGASDLLGRLRR